jgi:glycosyltransferase involved in cell wall biosynthesis
MLSLLTARSQVEVFDRAPRVNNAALNSIRQLLQPIRYISRCIRDRNSSLYLALSGGFGQIYDWPYVIVAKIFSRRIFIHHHSFAYLNKPSLLNRAFFSLVEKETHIVLSHGMGAALSSIYKIDPSSVKVVSNAAFFDSIKTSGAGVIDSSPPICLGYLSNITFEKGFVEFFEVVSQLKHLGISCQALIAGPVASDASTTFHRMLAVASGTEYLGPIYGEAKNQFYERLNFFLFPSDYINEAEPLVIHEALRSGAYVLACDRGAIAEMLGNGAGHVFTRDAFVTSAVEHIERFSRNRAELLEAQRMSLEQSQRIRKVAKVELESLLDDISGVIPAGPDGTPQDAHNSGNI